MFHQTQQAHSYRRRSPHLINLESDYPDLLNFFKGRISESEAYVPAEGYSVLENHYLFQGKYLLDEAGNWVDDSVRDFPNRSDVEELLRTIIDGNHFATNDKFLDKNIVHICKSGAGNYGHFLAEMAPKLINCKKGGFNDVALVMPEEAEWAIPLVDYFAKLLDIRLDYLRCGNTLTKFERINFFSSVAVHNFRKSLSLTQLSDVVLKDIHESHSWKRIFISRAGHKRNITNYEEIEAIAKSQGFVVLDAAKLDFWAQVSLFSGAEFVVGPLGAGLTNLIFCHPGASVMMVDPGIGDTFFWDICCLSGVDFWWLFSDKLSHYSLELESSDYFVEPELFESSLIRMVEVKS